MRYLLLVVFVLLCWGCASQNPTYSKTKNPYLLEEGEGLAFEDVQAEPMVVPSAPDFEAPVAEEALQKSLIKKAKGAPLDLIIVSDGSLLDEAKHVDEDESFELLANGRLIQAKSSQTELRVQGPFAETRLNLVYPEVQAKAHLSFSCPLPEGAGIRDFVISLGSRRVRGVITPKERAQEIFEKARQAGFNAALVTKPSFGKLLMKLSLQEKSALEINFHYSQLLKFDQGLFIYELPAVELATKAKITLIQNAVSQDLFYKGSFRRSLKFEVENKLFYSQEGHHKAYAFWDEKTQRLLSFLNEIPSSYKTQVKDFSKQEIQGDALLENAVYQELKRLMKDKRRNNFEQIRDLALKYKVLTPWSSILAVNASK